MDNKETAEFLKEQSEIAADLVVDALIDAKIIELKDSDRASEIAAEEILVQRSMESLRSNK